MELKARFKDISVSSAGWNKIQKGIIKILSSILGTFNIFLQP